MSLTGGHQQIRQVWVDFRYEGAEKLNKVLLGEEGSLERARCSPALPRHATDVLMYN